jgi:large subunit ribosomal protein L32
MPAVPRKKRTKNRIGKRRASQRLSAPAFTSCPRCHAPKMPHMVCPSCGTYNGRFVTSEPGDSA